MHFKLRTGPKRALNPSAQLLVLELMAHKCRSKKSKEWSQRLWMIRWSQPLQQTVSGAIHQFLPHTDGRCLASSLYPFTPSSIFQEKHPTHTLSKFQAFCLPSLQHSPPLTTSHHPHEENRHDGRPGRPPGHVGRAMKRSAIPPEVALGGRDLEPLGPMRSHGGRAGERGDRAGAFRLEDRGAGGVNVW